MSTNPNNILLTYSWDRHEVVVALEVAGLSNAKALDVDILLKPPREFVKRHWMVHEDITFVSRFNINEKNT